MIAKKLYFEFRLTSSVLELILMAVVMSRLTACTSPLSAAVWSSVVPWDMRKTYYVEKKDGKKHKYRLLP